MYVCLSCFELFEEPKHWYEDHGLDCPPYEHCSGSPCCCESYVETYRCDECGEWITTSNYVRIGDQRFCEHCFDVHDLADI